MRYSKRYIVFTLLLVVVLFFTFYNGKQSHAAVEQFRGATLDANDWDPMIAQSVNEKTLIAAIDNKVFTNKDGSIYMDNNRNIMIATDVLRDSFNCSVHLYDSTRLLVEKYADELTVSFNDPVAMFNNQQVNILSPMTFNGGRNYVPMQVVAEKLGYTYSWDIDENEVTVANTSGETNILPAAYDLRKKGRAPAVKNQGSRGTCWAFSALTALESTLLPEESQTFSTDHMSLQNSFSTLGDEGGQYTMSMAYLMSWQGPVPESEDPYDGVAVKGLSAVKHVQEAQIIESKNLTKIKEAVFKYGGVQTAIYSTLRNANSQSSFYNSVTNSYCYLGQEKPNHDVVIIGWDDNYSKDNFPVGLEGNGAFICQNSWGSNFGDNGVFYISYYDTNIGVHNVVYTDIENVNNYDHIYQSDLCGWVGQLGYNKDSAFGANVYTAGSNETVDAAGFYATGKNTEYEVYVVPKFTGPDSLSSGQRVANGRFENAGYYTIRFPNGVEVAKGDKFAVVIKILTPDSIHPLAIEYAADESTKGVDLTDGEGYISPQGSNWEHVEESQKCNLCIKAYTKER